MGSTRLPGKVMRPLAGMPVIWHVLERVSRIAGLSEVILATSTTPRDDELAAYVSQVAKVRVVRGPEFDVLDRFAGAVRGLASDAVVRFTADCPLLCPSVSARVIQRFSQPTTPCDYASNTLTRTFPRGLDTEVIATAALLAAHREATDPYDREHVTPFVWRHPTRFRLCGVQDQVDRSGYRWTLDTEADYDLIARIYDELYPVVRGFDYEEILRCLEAHPEWATINHHVVPNGRVG